MLAKTIYNQPIKLEVINRASSNNGKLILPNELKKIKPFAKIKDSESNKMLNLYIDKENNLWYKDNRIIIGCNTTCDNTKVLNTSVFDKAFIKISGLYERRNDFILDVLNDLSQKSALYYTDNTISSNLYLERLYEKILKLYFKEISN